MTRCTCKGCKNEAEWENSCDNEKLCNKHHFLRDVVEPMVFVGLVTLVIVILVLIAFSY